MRSLAALGLLAFIAFAGGRSGSALRVRRARVVFGEWLESDEHLRPHGCYWVPASNNAPLQPQLYPSQQQPTTSSLIGPGNTRWLGLVSLPARARAQSAGPAAPSGYSPGGASVVPGQRLPDRGRRAD